MGGRCLYLMHAYSIFFLLLLLVTAAAGGGGGWWWLLFYNNILLLLLLVVGGVKYMLHDVFKKNISNMLSNVLAY